MTKTLKDFYEVYRPKAKGEQRFVDKHVTIKHKDANGNEDDVFKATNVKPVDREKEHGYNPGSDEKVYEETLEVVAEGIRAYYEEVGEEISEEDLMDFANEIYESLMDELEEEEELTELSKQKLGKYVNRAAQDVEDRAYWEGRDGSNKKPYDDYSKKNSKRMAGIKKATAKLTKEDVINSFIDKYVTEEALQDLSLEDRLIEKLEPFLSESHIDTFVELFNTLNEDNQYQMIDHIIDQESVNDILNFIIKEKNLEIEEDD